MFQSHKVNMSRLFWPLLKTYRENGCERHVVVDATLSPSPQSQADEPHAGNPELVVGRGQVLQVPQLL